MSYLSNLWQEDDEEQRRRWRERRENLRRLVGYGASAAPGPSEPPPAPAPLPEPEPPPPAPVPPPPAAAQDMGPSWLSRAWDAVEQSGEVLRQQGSRVLGAVEDVAGIHHGMAEQFVGAVGRSMGHTGLGFLGTLQEPQPIGLPEEMRQELYGPGYEPPQAGPISQWAAEAAEELRGTMAQRDVEIGAPENVLEQGGAVAGAVLGPLLQYAATGRALSPAAPAAPGLREAIARNVVGGLPLTLARAGDPENTLLAALGAEEAAEIPALRYGSEAALDVLGAAGFETLAKAIRARRARPPAEAAAPVQPPAPEIPPVSKPRAVEPPPSVIYESQVAPPPPLEPEPAIPPPVPRAPEDLERIRQTIPATAAKTYKPAVRLDSGEVVAGEPGEIHAHVYQRLPKGVDAEAGGAEAGFVDDAGKFYTREDLVGLGIGTRENVPTAEEINVAGAMRRPVGGPAGRETQVIFPGDGRTVPGRYRAVEADELTPSHDPETFAPNPEMAEIQGRAYHGARGLAAREQVLSRPLREELVIDPTAAVEFGPPTITPSGRALAGTQRLILVQRAYRHAPERAAKYRQRFIEHAADYGLDPAEVERMRKPVLTRELDVDESDVDLLRQLNTLSDTPRGKTKDVLSDAETRARQLKGANRALEHFAGTIEGDQTLRDYLGKPAGRDFLRRLVDDAVIPAEEAARYVHAPTQTVTAEGKQLIERMMYAAAVGDADVVERAPAGILRKLEHAIPALVRASTQEGYDLGPALREALDVLTVAEASGAKSVEDVAQQIDLLGRRYHPQALDMARFLERAKQSEVKAAFRSYAQDAMGPDLFGGPRTPEESFTQRIANVGRPPPVARRVAAGRTPRLSPRPQMRVAFRGEESRRVYAGEPGEIHAMLQQRLRSSEPYHEVLALEAGFVDPQGRFLTRDEALQQYGGGRSEFYRHPELPEKHDDYFEMGPDVEVVPMERTVRSKGSQPSSAAVAKVRMREAARGELARRPPPEARLLPDGRYLILDGNATNEAAEKAGWTSFPVRVVDQSGRGAGAFQGGGTPASLSRSGEAAGDFITSPTGTPVRRQPPSSHVSEYTRSPSLTKRTMEPSKLFGPSSSSLRLGMRRAPGLPPKVQGRNNFDELLRIAKSKIRKIRSVLKDLAGPESFLEGRVKGEPDVDFLKDGKLNKGRLRIVDKMRQRGAQPDEISDYLGFRIITEDPEGMAARVLATFETIPEGTEPVRKAGYEAWHGQAWVGDDLSIEIQVQGPRIGTAQEFAHHFYDIFRADDYPARLKALAAEASEHLYRNFPEVTLAQARRIKNLKKRMKGFDAFLGRAPANYRNIYDEAERIVTAEFPEYRQMVREVEQATERRLREIAGVGPAPRETTEPRLMASQQLPAVQTPRMAAHVGTAAEAPKRSAIVADLQRALELPIRVGRLRQPKRVLGIYKVKPEVVRTRVANDIEAVAHEAGHHLHKLFFGATPKGVLRQGPLAPWAQELIPLSGQIGSGLHRSEGMAEYVRRYLTNPAEAEKAAPQFHAYFERRLADEFPEVHEALVRARDTYKLWQDASPRARVRAQISRKPTGIALGIRDRWQRFRTNVIDDMSPLQRAQEDILQGARPERLEEDAITLARLVRGSGGTADHFLERGTLDANGKIVGPGLRAIIEPLKDRWDDFVDYGMARRAVELHGRGIETGFRPEDATATVKELASPEFDKGFKAVVRYNNELMAYLRDSGVISQEAYDAFTRQNRDYFGPFYRVHERDQLGRAGAGPKLGHVAGGPKAIKGSGREVIDSLEGVVRNTYLYTRLAARQRVSKALAALAERHGAGKWIEPIPAPLRVTRTNIEEIVGGIRDPQAREAILEALKTSPTLADELLMLYRPGDYFKEPNVISHQKGGQRRWFQVDPELYAALEGLNTEQINSVVRLLSAPARWLRAGATLAPEFLGRNPFRDNIQAFVQSEYGFKPGIDFARGMFHLLKKDDLYWKWKAAGGEQAALVDLDRKALRKGIAQLAGTERVPNVVKNPLEGLRALSAAMENATRMGEFGRATRQGVEPGYAAAGAREVSIDFARHGAKTEAIRHSVGFWNARLEGYDRLARAFRQHPARTTARAAAAITLPSVLLYSVNRDEEEYWEFPQWQRDLFWLVKVPGVSGLPSEFLAGKQKDEGVWLRLPKPFELGLIFGAIPERILEWMDREDRQGLDKFFKETLWRELSDFVPIPTALEPIIENFANYSRFRQRPITPRALQDVEPRFQYTERTSDVAKGLGRLLSYPPTKIDHLLQAWGAGLGRLATDIVGAGVRAVEGEAPPRPARTWGDIPGVRGFIAREPGLSGSESVDRFYKGYGEASEAKRTFDLLRRENRLEELVDYVQQEGMPERIRGEKPMRKVSERLAELRKVRAAIERDRAMTPERKRELLRRVDRVGITLTRGANRAFAPAVNE